MADEIKDVFKKSFGEDSPLTEAQRQDHRNAAVFALLTFNQPLGDDEFKEMHATLPEEQVKLAKSFSDGFPAAVISLPPSEFNSSTQGFIDFITTMTDLLPALLKGKKLEYEGDEVAHWIPLERKEHLDPEYEIASRLFADDPSGISYAQHLLNQFEDKATQNKNLDLQEQIDEFRAKKAAIFGAAKDVSDESDPDFFIQQFEDVISGKKTSVMTDQTRRQVFL